MIELRTYTLASHEALERYTTIHWPRHLKSLPKYGITTRQLWAEINGLRLFAVVEYPDGVDPNVITQQYMGSTEFRADMDGFTMTDIVGVESVLIESALPATGPAS